MDLIQALQTDASFNADQLAEGVLTRKVALADPETIEFDLSSFILIKALSRHLGKI